MTHLIVTHMLTFASNSSSSSCRLYGAFRGNRKDQIQHRRIEYHGPVRAESIMDLLFDQTIVISVITARLAAEISSSTITDKNQHTERDCSFSFFGSNQTAE